MTKLTQKWVVELSWTILDCMSVLYCIVMRAYEISHCIVMGDIPLYCHARHSTVCHCRYPTFFMWDIQLYWHVRYSTFFSCENLTVRYYTILSCEIYHCIVMQYIPLYCHVGYPTVLSWEITHCIVMQDIQLYWHARYTIVISWEISHWIGMWDIPLYCIVMGDTPL